VKILHQTVKVGTPFLLSFLMVVRGEAEAIFFQRLEFFLLAFVKELTIALCVQPLGAATPFFVALWHSNVPMLLCKFQHQSEILVPLFFLITNWHSC
jgi:hypothetical protein